MFYLFNPLTQAVPNLALPERSTLTLALTNSRATNQACLYGWHPFIWVLLPVELFDLRRGDESHVTAAAALLALAALPSVLVDAVAAALLALDVFLAVCGHPSGT